MAGMTSAEPGKALETRLRLREAGRILVTVAGGCMTPTLREGQQVLVRGGGRPRVGDVALLDARGWLEIHRLVARIESGPRDWYVHMGDASSEFGLVGPGEILGRVEVTGRRGAPAWRAHLWAMLLRLGALLRRVGMPFAERLGSQGFFVEWPRNYG